MNRTAQSKWMLVNPTSHEENERLINSVIRQSSTIKESFNIRQDYDLANELVGSLYCFLRTKSKYPDLKEEYKQHKFRLAEIDRTKSFGGAGTREIIELVPYGLKTIENPRSKLSSIIRSARNHRDQNTQGEGRYKHGGRYPDLAIQLLCRTLPVIYYRGTGKLPASGRRKSHVRGRYIEFARQCCEALRIEVSDSRLNEYMLEVRDRLKKPHSK